MKLSVIIPVYNCEDYLRECLDSLVQQTLQDMEILAVDDGSSDSSGSILDEYAKTYPNKVKVFHKENGGQASARNYALAYATGEYLGFVDSDDWVDLKMYENMVAIADNSKYEIVVCDMVDHYPTHIVHHDASHFIDKFKQTPSACNKIFLKELVQSIKFPQGYWYEDFCFTTKALFLSDRIGRCHEGAYHCHCREESTMTNNNSKKNLDIIFILEELHTFAKEKNLTQNYQDVLAYLVLDHILITSINRVAQHQSEERDAVIQQLRDYVLEKYPNMLQTKAYKQLPRNRKIIAYLNYKGCWKVSNRILQFKKKH